MIESIRQSVVYMAHTHDGARVAMNSLWHGTAKVRTRSNATTARAHAGVLLLQTVEKQPSLFSFFLHGSHLKNSARKQNLWAQNTRRESLIGFCLRKDSCTQFRWHKWPQVITCVYLSVHEVSRRTHKPRLLPVLVSQYRVAGPSTVTPWEIKVRLKVVFLLLPIRIVPCITSPRVNWYCGDQRGFLLRCKSKAVSSVVHLHSYPQVLGSNQKMRGNEFPLEDARWPVLH